MPELPDISVYVDALSERIVGQPLRNFRVANPFLLRTVEPPPSAFVDRRVLKVERLAKRLVFHFDDGYVAVLHLMIAGRLHWKRSRAKLGRGSLLALDFDTGTVTMTEAGSKRRASLHLFSDPADVASLDRGGLDPLTLDLGAFRAAAGRENHTLKRALTDQRLLAGIGNAYSDEILFAARLSPFRQTKDLDDAEWSRLHQATVNTLNRWTERLTEERKGGFPTGVTAFREEMAVHGRYGEPCPICSSPVQRIVYAQNEANYCARCQTGGRLLADRALSRLLKKNWPKTIDELEG